MTLSDPEVAELKNKLMELSPIWMWAGNADASRGYFGSRTAALEFTGYPVEAFLDNPALFFELVHPDDRQHVQECHETAVRERRTVRFEYRLVRRDGDERRFRNLVVPEFAEDGTHLAFYGYTMDITETHALEQSLRRTQTLRLIGQLAQGLAHDFNNVLAGVGGAVEVLGIRIPHDPMVQETATEVLDLVRRGRDLSRCYMALGRDEEPRDEHADAHDTIRSVTRLLRPTVARGVQIVEELNAARPEVAVDSGVVHSIVLNLAVNACEAMCEGGNITIRTELVDAVPDHVARAALEEQGAAAALEPDREHLRLQVADEGHGIDPANLDGIFEPYFSTRSKQDGAGLGLFLVDTIVRKARGAVHVESDLGKGAVFSVYLPTSEHVEDPTEREAPPAETSLERTCVLLVDDEPTLRESFSRVLQARGFEAHSADGGQDALRFVQTFGGRIDVILLDLHMPGITGLETARRLREEGIDAPVVLMSGNVFDLDAAAEDCDGVIGSLAKPFRVDDFIGIIARHRVRAPAGEDEAD